MPQLRRPVEGNTVPNPKHRPFAPSIESVIGEDIASQLAARFGRARSKK